MDYKAKVLMDEKSAEVANRETRFLTSCSLKDHREITV